MAKRRKNKVAKAIKKRRAAAEKASLPKDVPAVKETPVVNTKTSAKTLKWKGIKGKFGKIIGSLAFRLGLSKKNPNLKYPTGGGKYVEAKVLSGSRLEEEGVRRTSLSRDLDIREKLNKTKGTYDKDGQKDYITWLENNKRVYGRNKEHYSGLRTNEKFNPSISKSIERHERREIERKAIQERQGIKIESPATPPKSGKPVKQETAQVQSDQEPQAPTSEAEVDEVENAGEQVAASVKSGEAEKKQEPSFAELHPLNTSIDHEANRLKRLQESEDAKKIRQSRKIEPYIFPDAKKSASSDVETGVLGKEAEQAKAAPDTPPTPKENPTTSDTPTGSGDDSYDAKLKALRKKGRANEYAADRIDQERKEVIDMINAGNYKDAAGALGFSGDYTAEKANELRQAAEKHAMDAVNEGAGIMDYVNAYHVPGAIGGAAILAGTGVALMGDNGRKSNEQLYSSPF